MTKTNHENQMKIDTTQYTSNLQKHEQVMLTLKNHQYNITQNLLGVLKESESNCLHLKWLDLDARFTTVWQAMTDEVHLYGDIKAL